MTVSGNVELVDNIVARVKRKFDNPGPDLDPNLDFDSWKRRRIELQQVTVSHGQREQEGQGVVDDKGLLRKLPLSVSEMGLQRNTKININHDCYSISGEGDAGVQQAVGVQGDGDAEVHTVQYRISQQRDPRRVGSFLVSGELPDNAAATVGKPVLMGESHSTNFAP